MTLTGSLDLAAGIFQLETHTLTLGGSFTNRAALDAEGGTLLLQGGAGQTVAGASLTAFHHLTGQFHLVDSSPALVMI